jgi:phospholipase C
VTDAFTTPPLPPEEAEQNLQKFDHLVVLMMENRSFDHMLGYLTIDGGRDEVDGVRPGMKNEHEGKAYPVHPATSTRLIKAQDPCHSGSCVDEQVAGGCSGYVSNFAKTRTAPLPPGSGFGIVMAYHTAEQLPVYDYVADQFCICDRWFCSVPGATMPNRLYAACGRAAGSRDPAHPPIYRLPSFVRHLDNAGASWRWYSHDDFPLLWSLDSTYALSHPRIPAYFDRDVLPFARRSFLKRAAAGDLPAVSWIDPNFIDFSVGPGGSNDDHPPSDLHAGQDLVLRLFHAVVTSPAWPKTVLLITYDEHGGFFDHVEPPAAPDDDARFRRYGARVPAIVISPWVGAREVAHTRFDHTSIVKTILMRFCRRADGSIPNMGTRVAHANHLGELLTEAQPRPAPDPADYQHLIEEFASWRAKTYQEELDHQRTRGPAQPPELNDWQEEYLEAKREFAAMAAGRPAEPAPA